MNSSPQFNAVPRYNII